MGVVVLCGCGGGGDVAQEVFQGYLPIFASGPNNSGVGGKYQQIGVLYQDSSM